VILAASGEDREKGAHHDQGASHADARNQPGGDDRADADYRHGEAPEDAQRGSEKADAALTGPEEARCTEDEDDVERTTNDGLGVEQRDDQQAVALADQRRKAGQQLAGEPDSRGRRAWESPLRGSPRAPRR
jgi:hypothetical protein